MGKTQGSVTCPHPGGSGHVATPASSRSVTTRPSILHDDVTITYNAMQIPDVKAVFYISVNHNTIIMNFVLEIHTMCVAA